MRPIVTLICIVALVACGGAPPRPAHGARPQLTPHTPVHMGQRYGLVEGETVAGWRFERQVVNPGTRSEYLETSLQVDGKQPEPALAPLYTPVGAFEWHTGGWPPDRAGHWRPLPRQPKAPRLLGDELGKAELAAGRYAMEDGHKRPGTPAGWCYSRVERAWLSPARVMRRHAPAGLKVEKRQ